MGTSKITMHVNKFFYFSLCDRGRINELKKEDAAAVSKTSIRKIS